MASTICRLHLTEQLNQQGDVDAAEHLLDASIGAPMAHVESFRKGIGVEDLLPVQSVLTPPLLQSLHGAAVQQGLIAWFFQLQPIEPAAMGGDLDLTLLQPLLEVATGLRDVHAFRLAWLGPFTTPGVVRRMKGVWQIAVTMKPLSPFGLSLGFAGLCANPAFAQTNQQLLQEGLISPTVFELLQRRGAQTPDQRFEVIRQACSARELPPIDCGTSRRRRHD